MSTPDFKFLKIRADLGFAFTAGILIGLLPCFFRDMIRDATVTPTPLIIDASGEDDTESFDHGLIHGDDALDEISYFIEDHPTSSRAINIPHSLIDAMRLEMNIRMRAEEIAELGGFRAYYSKSSVGESSYSAILIPVNTEYEVRPRSDEWYFKTRIPYRMANPCPDMCYGEIGDRPPIGTD